VNADGTIDAANSHGITASDGPSSQVSKGFFCLTVQPTPHTAVASSQAGGGTMVITDVDVGAADAASAIAVGWCAQGTNLLVLTANGFSQFTDGFPVSFYVDVN
jgi:hypothetical protein